MDKIDKPYRCKWLKYSRTVPRKAADKSESQLAFLLSDILIINSLQSFPSCIVREFVDSTEGTMQWLDSFAKTSSTFAALHLAQLMREIENIV